MAFELLRSRIARMALDSEERPAEAPRAGAVPDFADEMWGVDEPPPPEQLDEGQPE